MANKQTITINGVTFILLQLLENFPNSYFTTMFNSQYRESNQTDIVVKFPSHIDPFGTNAKRYIQQLAYRIQTGKYQYPQSDPASRHSIMPIADGIRFISFDEMKNVFSFLMFVDSELNLVDDKPVEHNASNDYEEEDYDDDDAYQLTEKDYDNLDEKLLPDDYDDHYDEEDDDDHMYGYRDT